MSDFEFDTFEEEALREAEEFTTCPTHGTRIPYFTDCPVCIQEENDKDAAQEAREVDPLPNIIKITWHDESDPTGDTDKLLYTEADLEPVTGLIASLVRDPEFSHLTYVVGTNQVTYQAIPWEK